VTHPNPTIPPSRAAALTAIEHTLPVNGKPGQDLQGALDNALRPLADPRDKGLATELTYGYFRLKGRMEHLVRAHLAKPEKTHPLIVRILALAAYELTVLTGVPTWASLSWAVDAVKSRFGQTQANVANAVLRRIQALGAESSQQSFYESSSHSRLQALCAWFSCPVWLYELWTQEYDEEHALELMRSQLLPPINGVRCNTAHPQSRACYETLTNGRNILFDQYPWVGFAPGDTNPLLSDVVRLEHDGVLSRQSAAVGDILNRLGYQSWVGPIWDACCGRGGKTTALLELNGPRVFASDPNKRRLKGLVAEAARLGFDRPTLFVADASMPPFRSIGGTILLDAPCSGLGVLSRRPDAKWKRTRRDIDNLALIQKALLTSCSSLLRPGGRLVYMTCTMTRQENEQQDAFLQSLGLAREVIAKPESGPRLREFFWGGVWKK
jgi:16S rRNA (cytosine967-C5)-methyltransferase